MIALHPEKRRKLIASARLLTSDKPGEQLAALSAILRLLPDGMAVADVFEAGLPPVMRVVPPEPKSSDMLRPWRNKAKQVLNDADLLTERELEFVQAMEMRRYPPTPRQQAWLDSLAAELAMGAAA